MEEKTMMPINNREILEWLAKLYKPRKLRTVSKLSPNAPYLLALRKLECFIG